MSAPTLFDGVTCQSRHFGPPCLADATCETRTGVGPFKPTCDRCADAVERWAGSPGLSGLRYQTRPLEGTSCRTP